MPFDPTQPFDVESSGPLQVTVAAPRQFDPSKPFEVEQPDIGAAFQQFADQPAPAVADQQRMEQLASAYRRAPEGQGMAVDRRAEELRKSTNPYVQATMQGLTFGLEDELSAGLRTVAGQGQGYGFNLAAQREALDRARQDNPVGMAGAEIAGALLTAPLAPAVKLVQGAGWGGRALNAAAGGALYGGAYGAGAGEGVQGRAEGAAMGAATGGALGAVMSPAVDAVTAGGRAVINRATAPFRGARDAEAEAARRIGVALQADNVDPVQARQALEASRQSGSPAVVADFGGETTRALARSSANTAPEAREALVAATQPRFEGQGDRTVDAIRRATGASGDTSGVQEALKEAARRANRPAYERAYSQGRQVWTQDLADITSAPAVQSAIREATSRSRNVAASEGGRPVRNPFNVDPQTGAVSLKEGMTPDLQFWDVVKRNLDSQIGALRRAGDGGRAGELTALKNRMVGVLDQVVPSYKAARQGAAAAFGAEDALEAGQKFVTSTMDNGAASRAMGKLSAAERDLFREGFASTLISRVRELRDNRDVVKAVFGSPAARERVNIALGTKQAKELEAFIKGEEMMDRLRLAVQGNSSTARQLAELGLAGGAGLIAGGGNPLDLKALATSALVYGLRRGSAKIDARVARRVGEFLASDDPAIFDKAVQLLARDGRLSRAVTAATDFLSRAARPTTGTVPAPQGVISGRTEDDETPGP